MVTVAYDEVADTYWIMSAGKVLDRRDTASEAKEVGKRLGRERGEPVSYQGPRMESARFIQAAPEPAPAREPEPEPEPERQRRRRRNGGLFGGLF